MSLGIDGCFGGEEKESCNYQRTRSVHHKSSCTRDIEEGVVVKLALFNVRQTHVQEQHSVVFSMLYNFPSSVLCVSERTHAFRECEDFLTLHV